jgi:hypothetical protein
MVILGNGNEFTGKMNIQEIETMHT